MVTKHIENFDIKQIAASGQIFRVEEFKSPETYTHVIQTGNKFLMVQQAGKEVDFHCSENDFKNYWQQFFDLDRDYGQIIAGIDEADEYLKAAAAAGDGDPARSHRKDTSHIGRRGHIRNYGRYEKKGDLTMKNKISIEIEAKYNTTDVLKKAKKIKKHARKMEKLAREIGYFPTEAAHMEATRATPVNGVRYGIKIKKDEKDPAKRVSYIYDAEGMTPARMNFEKGVFDYGTWPGVGFLNSKANYPCMVDYDGAEVYRLDPNNYSKREEGGPSDITNPGFPGNTMAAFVGGYLAQYEDKEYEYIIWSNVKYDERYNAEHRTDTKGRELEGFYYRIFTPANIDGKARSFSSLEPTRNNTAYDEMELIELNGGKWSGLTWSRYNYIISLLMILGKTENLRNVFGTGNSSSGRVLEGGRLNTKGQFFGTNDGKEQVKVFHIEALWGNQFTRCMGLIAKGKQVLVSPHGPYNLTGDGYEVMADVDVDGFEYGFVDKTKMTKYGRVAMSFNGSENTHTCNFASIDTSGDAEVAVVGGYASDGASCGFYVSLNNSPSGAYWNIAPGLSCEMPLKA